MTKKEKLVFRTQLYSVYCMASNDNGRYVEVSGIPCNYKIVNTIEDEIEMYSPMLPAAIQTAIQLTEALKEMVNLCTSDLEGEVKDGDTNGEIFEFPKTLQ